MSRTNPQLKYQDLYALEIGYYYNFEPIKDYLDKTKKMIDAQEKSILKKMDKWQKKNYANPNVPHVSEVFHHEANSIFSFTSISNNSVFLTIYSLFESSFFHLCERCKMIENLKLGAKDLSGSNYIGQCRKYITTVIDVNLESLNETWNTIGKYQLIRNCIAHKNGVLKELNQDMLQFIKKTDGITIGKQSHELNLESIDFLKNFIDLVVKFLTGVSEEIIKQKSRA